MQNQFNTANENNIDQNVAATSQNQGSDAVPVLLPVIPVPVRKTVDPQMLVADAMIEHTATLISTEIDEIFLHESKEFREYVGAPVVDRDGNVLTNFGKVLAAQKNGDTTIEVLEADLDEITKRRFLLQAYRFTEWHPADAYKMAIYLKEAVKEHPYWKILADSLSLTDTRAIVANLMHTSDATIKRLWRIGNERPSWFALIAQGEASIKEAERKVALDAGKKNKQQPTPIQPPVPCLEPEQEENTQPEGLSESGDRFNEFECFDEEPIEHGVGDEEPLPKKDGEADDRNEDPNGSKLPIGDTPDPLIGEGQAVVPTRDGVQFVELNYPSIKGKLKIDGMGTFYMDTTGLVPYVRLGDVQIPNMQFTQITTGSGNQYSDTQSFLLNEKDIPKGLCIQVIISNYDKRVNGDR